MHQLEELCLAALMGTNHCNWPVFKVETELKQARQSLHEVSVIFLGD